MFGGGLVRVLVSRHQQCAVVAAVTGFAAGFAYTMETGGRDALRDARALVTGEAAQPVQTLSWSVRLS